MKKWANVVRKTNTEKYELDKLPRKKIQDVLHQLKKEGYTIFNYLQ